MGFILGNHFVDEVLYIVGQKQSGEIFYALDQTRNASIEINSESTDVTDKNGNVVKTRYTAKTGTVSITQAFMHPAAMNVASGSDIQVAGAGAAAIQMPCIAVVDCGGEVNTTGALEGTIHVVGMYGNGANKVLTAEEVAACLSNNNTKFTAPAQATGEPIQYLIRYEYNETSGIKLVNDANKFPDAHQQTWFCAYGDPCKDDLQPMYVVLPHVVADPSATLNFDRENQDFDFNATLNVDYCTGSVKGLYYIYYPDKDLVVSGVSNG